MPSGQLNSEFMCLRSNHQNTYFETFKKHLKIVKKEPIYEDASLKSLNLLNELELLHNAFPWILLKFK